jgi:hypothetical protein
MKLQESVLEQLERHANARDNDVILFGFVLHEMGLDLKQTSAAALLHGMVDRNLPSFESVSRARRLVQQRRPDLRGSSYEGRQKLARIYRRMRG